MAGQFDGGVNCDRDGSWAIDFRVLGERLVSRWSLGVEIGGTKLQVAIGRGDAPRFHAQWRTEVTARDGAEPIRQQLLAGIRGLLLDQGIEPGDIAGVGIGFGGPVDTASGTTVVSHQVHGWERFPLVDWFRVNLGLRAVLHNDADTAAFAEATFGAGQGCDPVLYITVGSGIGGGLVLNQKIYRGCGAGALEIGHLRPGLPLSWLPDRFTVEQVASGFGMEQRARTAIANSSSLTSQITQHAAATLLAAVSATDNDPAMQTAQRQLAESVQGDLQRLSARGLATAAEGGNPFARRIIADATETLGWAIAQAITLVNPARVVIGGGVSLMPVELFMNPVTEAAKRYAFAPFEGLADIVPAALGEEVVLHGAVALAAQEYLQQPTLRVVSGE